MANFIETDLEALSVKVGQQVLTDLEPALVAVADRIAVKIIAEITSVIESKLKA